VVVARADNRDVFRHRTLADLFADKQLRFGAKTGYSYGPFADDLIQANKPPMVRTTQDVGGLVRSFWADVSTTYWPRPRSSRAWPIVWASPVRTSRPSR